MKIVYPLIFFISVVLVYPQQQQLRAQDDNDTWEPGTVVQDRFGVEMVYVPSGTFELGIDREQAVAFCERVTSLDRPRILDVCINRIEDTGVFLAQEVEVPGFWIDRYETTNEQFDSFSLSFSCQADYGCRALVEAGQSVLQVETTQPDHPVILDWWLALQYCYLRGARLPIETEWEYAASGPENNIYPWGNDIDHESIEDYYSVLGFYPVGSKPINVSWIGVYDMAGNAEEWVDDSYRPYGGSPDNVADDGARVARGGSIGPVTEITTYIRFPRIPNNLNNSTVRCARSTPPN